MIRLTELERSGPAAAVKIEGHLTESTLPVLVQALAEYRRDGLAEVRLLADGLQQIDIVALGEARSHFPAEIQLSFHTSRLVVGQMLENRGFTVVLSNPPYTP